MKNLEFVRECNGKREVLAHCSDIPEEEVPGTCQNFIDGFLLAMDTYTQVNLWRPCNMVADGWKCWLNDGKLKFEFVIKDTKKTYAYKRAAYFFEKMTAKEKADFMSCRTAWIASKGLRKEIEMRNNN